MIEEFSISVTDAGSLSVKERADISRLHFKDGYMYKAYKKYLKDKSRYSCVIMSKQKEKVVGWAYLFGVKNNSALKLHVYVHSKFRNRGIGRSILQKAEQMVIEKKLICQVAPHDKTSKEFYKNWTHDPHMLEDLKDKGL